MGRRTEVRAEDRGEGRGQRWGWRTVSDRLAHLDHFPVNFGVWLIMLECFKDYWVTVVLSDI